jgi:carboxyl-terminal processing protease
MKLPEAKTNVNKSWDRVLRRLKDTKQDDIYSGYLDSFARALDPHSSFFSKDVLEDFEITMSLSLEGIGATLSSQDGFTIIDALVPGGAAARSSLLLPQDKIIAVGQGEKGELENVVEWDLRDVVRKIRGKKVQKFGSQFCVKKVKAKSVWKLF